MSNHRTEQRNWKLLMFSILFVLTVFFISQRVTGLNFFGEPKKDARVSVDGEEIVESQASITVTRSGGCSLLKEGASNRRVIVVGDIHGSYEGLLENLFEANITIENRKCEWKIQEVPTLLVQMGDMVDRGAGALEALECLRYLQESASTHNAEVVRLLGNHELWWLTGIFYQRNAADTQERVVKFLRVLWDDVLNRRVVGSYIHHINDQPIMFVHAGYSNDFVKYLKLNTAEEIANYTNNHLVHSVSQCTRLPCASITKDELYEAGPSRGGSGIGGPYWTDFTTLLEEDNEASLHPNDSFRRPFSQIVGHTMAFCYDPRNPGKHPQDHVAECSLGLIRPSTGLFSVCVDGGMYAGARAFLEITTSGRYLAHEKRGNISTSETSWIVRDLTKYSCGV